MSERKVPPTKRQSEALKFIEQWPHKYSARCEDVGSHLGITRFAAAYLIRQLVAKGYLERSGRQGALYLVQ